MKRMTKMEAVAILWEIRKSIEGQKQFTFDRVKKDLVEPGLETYLLEEAEKYDRRIRALEMAGTAMTR